MAQLLHHTLRTGSAGLSVRMRALEELSSFLVGQQQLPTLHYIPDLISEAEEQRLLQEVHASKAKWVQLSGRRLQNHGGIVHTKGLIPAPLPNWLQQLIQNLPEPLQQLFPADQPPNHVLINSYQPGCGIMPHEDGPLYHPVVLILSLGSPAVLRFWRKHESGGTGGQPPAASLLAMPRSLLVFQEEAYTHCLHGIEEVSQELLDSSVVNTARLTAAAAGNAVAAAPPGQQPACAVHPHALAQPQLQQQQLQPQQCKVQQQQQQQQQQQVAQNDPQTQLSQHELCNGHSGGKCASEDAFRGCSASCQDVCICAGAGSNQGAATASVQLPDPNSSIDSDGSKSSCGHGQVQESCPNLQSFARAGAGPSTEAGAVGCLLPRQGERVSLTIRRVLKVHKALGILGRR